MRTLQSIINEMPQETKEALLARAKLGSSESVAWPGKISVKKAPKFEDEDVDCTYIAYWHEGHIWLDARIPALEQLPTTLTIDAKTQPKRKKWTELHNTGDRGKGWIYK